MYLKLTTTIFGIVISLVTSSYFLNSFYSKFFIENFSKTKHINLYTHEPQNSHNQLQENEENKSSVNHQINSVIKPEDKIRFEQIIQYSKTNNLKKKPVGEVMSAIAQQFLGTPYQVNLLDQSDQERLIISLTQFDCFLFIETVLALTRGIKQEDQHFNHFQERVMEQRYRDGEMNGYCSRLHYFSEWIRDNEKKKTLIDITSKLGGIFMNKNLNFMSKNRHLYPRLINSDKNYQCIQNMENNLKYMKIHYLPTSQIRSIEHLLKPGDIIGVATETKGLDVSHTGLITKVSQEKVSLIHASPSGEVTIASDLARYVSNVPSAQGILVARPLIQKSNMHNLEQTQK